MKKTVVYIDGFNLYYRLKHTPYKWLNLEKLSQSYLDLKQNQIIKIKYFTALVKEQSRDPSNTIRQGIYLRALKTLPNLEIIFGQFKKRHINLSLATKNPDKLKQVKKIIGNNINPFFKYEEKETDVKYSDTYYL